MGGESIEVEKYKLSRCRDHTAQDKPLTGAVGNTFNVITAVCHDSREKFQPNAIEGWSGELTGTPLPLSRVPAGKFQ